MSPESLLAEKLTTYRSAFDKACRGLFSSGEGVTLEYEHDDDEDAVDVTAASSAPPASSRVFDVSNDGSNFAREIRGAVRSIAEDFAYEFNAKLTAAASVDPTVALVADRYEMGRDHIDELDALLAVPVATLLGRLAEGDLDGARRATLDAWPLLEKRIRSKWQAYFVLTFQDVSVERKAARDRRTLQPRFDLNEEMLATAEAQRRSRSDFAAAADARPRGRSPWITVLMLLLLAAAGGWLLMRGHTHPATASLSTPSPRTGPAPARR